MCFPEQVILPQNSLEHDFPSAACVRRCLSLPQKRWISHDRTTFLIRRSTLLYQTHRGCVLWHSIFPSHLDKWCFFFILLLCQDTTIKGSQRRKSLLCPALQSVSPWRPCWPTWQQTDSMVLEEQLGAHMLRRQLPGGEKSWQEWPGLSGPEIHPSPLAHPLQHGHISESCPESSTDFRPSTQTL